jgi:quercetin dioxygenase-like cupin family protein
MAVLAKGIDYFGADGFPITARRVRTEPGGRPSHLNDVTEIDHYHDFSELVLILSGRGRHLLEGESFPVAAGNVFVVQGNQVHSFRDREGLVLVSSCPPAFCAGFRVTARFFCWNRRFAARINFRAGCNLIARIWVRPKPWPTASNRSQSRPIPDMRRSFWDSLSN